MAVSRKADLETYADPPPTADPVAPVEPSPVDPEPAADPQP